MVCEEWGIIEANLGSIPCAEAEVNYVEIRELIVFLQKKLQSGATHAAYDPSENTIDALKLNVKG